jgi:hypothetical protein
VAALKKLTEQNHPLLEKLTAAIDARLGTESRLSIKTDQSLLNKARRPSILAETPWFRVEHVRDSLRFMTAIRDPGDVGSILGMLLDARIRLVKIDVRKARPVFFFDPCFSFSCAVLSNVGAAAAAEKVGLALCCL